MFINHMFAHTLPLPPIEDGKMFEYVVASNGVFIRAKRPEMNAMIWVASTESPIRGLEKLAPYLNCHSVPAHTLARMIEMAYRAKDKEILFYLSGGNPSWKLSLPEQIQHGASVQPVDPYVGAMAAIEVHSHHNMQTFFSGTDDKEERQGFRIYAVLGNLGLRPSILVRVGIYGHFYQIPATWAFDLPAGVSDALEYETAESKELQYLDMEDVL